VIPGETQVYNKLLVFFVLGGDNQKSLKLYKLDLGYLLN